MSCENSEAAAKFFFGDDEKRFRRLSVLIHADKCKLPGADDAFVRLTGLREMANPAHKREWVPMA